MRSLLCVSVVFIILHSGCDGAGTGGTPMQDTDAGETGVASGDEEGSSTGEPPDFPPDFPTGDSTGDSTGDPTGDPTGSDVEHALGMITLSEAHGAEGGAAAGSVTASFIPDARALNPTCGSEVAGCRVATVPDCGGGCGPEAYCGFNDGCASVCLDLCDADCDRDQVCYFPSPGQAACREREDFDAGSLTFSGTTTPITLFPPYTAEAFESGSPFAPGNDVTISASGATGAGFVSFEETFTTTTLMQSGLEDITLSQAYGSADMPVQWAEGSDEVEVIVTVTAVDGGYGTVTCEADDAAGSFAVPRTAIEAAVDGASASGIAVSVTRRRTEVAQGLSTQGMLLHAEVQPEAWLEFTTLSSESHVVEGCGAGELVCGDACTDVLWDADNCGDCDEVCNGQCQNGECLAEDDDEACSDGEDNDDDGFVDCHDFDCSMSAAVTVCGDEDDDAACSDDFDNDGDGYVDCDDFNCSMNPDVTVC